MNDGRSPALCGKFRFLPSAPEKLVNVPHSCTTSLGGSFGGSASVATAPQDMVRRPMAALPTSSAATIRTWVRFMVRSPHQGLGVTTCKNNHVAGGEISCLFLIQ